jgi:hypothetical protein
MFTALQMLLGLRWAEADRVARLVETLPDAVDPPEAEGFVERLRVGDPGLARALLGEPDQELPGVGVVILEPPAELRGGSEEPGPHLGST